MSAISMTTTGVAQTRPTSPYQQPVVLGLAVLLGVFGVHRFYVGKSQSGLGMALTFGGLGIWWIYDIVLIVTGQFTDSTGRTVGSAPMQYTAGRPPTPSSRLRDGGWRIRNSAWTLWGILTLGVLSWVGFAYIGLKAKSARWLIMASVLLAAFIVLIAIPAESSYSWINNIIIPVMLASIALAFFENRTWLRFRAEQAPTRPWFEQGVEPDSLGNVVPSPAETAGPLPQMGIREPYFAHAPSPAAEGAGVPTVDSLLDVNVATHSDLLTLPGFDEPTAERVITRRDSIGGFRSIPDFESAAKLPPHLLVRVRKLVECRRTHTSDSALQSGSKPSLGRQVDL